MLFIVLSSVLGPDLSVAGEYLRMLSLKLHWRNLSDSQQTFSSCALKLETGLNDLIFHKSQLLVTARISMSLLTP